MQLDVKLEKVAIFLFLVNLIFFTRVEVELFDSLQDKLLILLSYFI